MRGSKDIGVARVGLLVVAAISMAAASGRKPSKEQQATVSLRRISASEVMTILHKFPEMVPGRFTSAMNDTGFVKDLFPFGEVTSASLDRVFPGIQFYKGLSGSKPPYPYLMAIAGSKRYMMPDGFNQLLLEGGQKVTEKNIVALAKAFVVLALGNQRMFGNPIFGGPQGDELLAFPQITFLDAKGTKLVTGRPTDAAVLKVRIGAQVEEWHFSVLWNQLEGVSRANGKGLILDYSPVMVESLPGRGQLDPTPNMTIGTYPTNGDAYVEFDSLNQAHYYVIVKRNQDSTGKKVVFSLLGGFRGHNT